MLAEKHAWDGDVKWRLAQYRCICIIAFDGVWHGNIICEYLPATLPLACCLWYELPRLPTALLYRARTSMTL
jgi:hypothetical protein